MGDVETLRAGLALLAARFVLPGLGPDVDQAIRLACELLVRGLDTPTPARPGRSREFHVVLRALATGSLAVDEFYISLIDYLPAWDKQDELDRRLMALLDDWER